MTLAAIVALVAIVVAVFMTGSYIADEKKNGSRCDTCPYSDDCRGKDTLFHCYQTKY